MAATENKQRHVPSVSSAQAWIILVTLFSAESALADQWTLTPSVSARAELTDNVGQAPDGNKESALILGVTPGFRLQSVGARRLKVDVSYFLSGVERLGEKNTSSDLNHSLGARANAEIVDQLFFVDATANVSQVLTSLLGAPGGGTLDTGNLTTVGTYSLSPYLTKRFGTFAAGQVRYTTSGALFQNNAGGDINANTLTAALNSGSRFNDLSWALNYSLRDAKIHNDGSNQFEHYDATLGYALTRKIRAFGSVGYDNNDYPSLTKTSGPSWTAGLGWSPSRLTSMDGSVGHNYFGNTYSANFNHRSHFSTWFARYSEGVNDISQVLLAANESVIWDCTGEGFQVSSNLTAPFPDCAEVGTLQNAQDFLGPLLGLTPQGVVEFLLSRGVPLLSLANGVFLNKTFNGGVSWTKGKNSLGLNIFDTKRIFQNLGGLPGDETRGITGLYGYRLDPRTTLNTSLSLTNNLVPASLSGLTTDRNDKIYIASVGMTRQFQPKLSGSLIYRYTTRRSNDSAFDFNENNLTALVNMTF
ncbi:MAG TPA: TIGR03016 family PEP-CTERM system-associated outer membrane protein [Thiobacillaceae bacterium]|nr:TIGR03016 family PEP-CTERM system-associated outer membrane protein [Thiobacillaceae bacterium]